MRGSGIFFVCGVPVEGAERTMARESARRLLLLRLRGQGVEDALYLGHEPLGVGGSADAAEQLALGIENQIERHPALP